jgi:hypothetical protein
MIFFALASNPIFSAATTDIPFLTHLCDFAILARLDRFNQTGERQ